MKLVTRCHMLFKKSSLAQAMQLLALEQIGEKVMNELKTLDQVAYVRFASVYRQFKDINSFKDELNELLKE